MYVRQIVWLKYQNLAICSGTTWSTDYFRIWAEYFNCPFVLRSYLKWHYLFRPTHLNLKSLCVQCLNLNLAAGVKIWKIGVCVEEEVAWVLSRSPLRSFCHNVDLSCLMIKTRLKYLRIWCLHRHSLSKFKEWCKCFRQFEIHLSSLWLIISKYLITELFPWSHLQLHSLHRHLLPRWHHGHLYLLLSENRGCPRLILLFTSIR